MLPAIFHTSLWYTPESQRQSSSPAEFLIKTFPYHFLSAFKLSEDISKLEGVHLNTIERSIFEYCVIDFHNVTDANGLPVATEDLIKVLPTEIINDILGFIFSTSMYNASFVDSLSSSLYTLYNPRFAGESWQCSYCQRRKLDEQRNCPFLPTEGHDSQITYPTVDGVVTQCPIGTVDKPLADKALEAYVYRDQALLPEDGGIRNQTVFFMLASQKVKEVVNYYSEQEKDNTK